VKEELLIKILEQYGMESYSSNLIRHNENMTYCIEDQYLLRVHKEKAGFNTVQYYNGIDKYKMHEAELEFLEYLRNKGISVQSPIRNTEGKLVTALDDGTLVTMLTWIPGRVLEATDLSGALSYQLGKMIARLHMVSQGYDNNNFIHYNQDLCQRLGELLTYYYERGKLVKQYYEIMLGTFALIGDILIKSEKEHILVHSDLSLSNILITDNGLVPIDFSLMGYSNPLLDFGSLFCIISDYECRDSAIKGYEAVSGCSVNSKDIEPYFAIQILLGIVIHFELWMNEEWFAKRLPMWCNEVFLPLIQ
jgi:Ser/Thr protein kinase RdoA (MazF antagonist)